jgi:hypothetical protein
MLDVSAIPRVAQATWTGPAASRLSESTLIALFEDRIPCISLPGAVSPRDCDRLARACENAGFDYYDDIVPPVGRIGVTQYEYRHRPRSEYFAAAREAEEKHLAIARFAEIDPVAAFAAELGALKLSAGLATERGPFENYGSRLVRQIPMAKLHVDVAALCAQGWRIGEVQQQITWNLYLQEPPGGGECLVYNKQWVPADDLDLEEAQPLSSYGYPASTVAGATHHTIRPKQGDVVLFNTRNFHEVKPSVGGVRLSLTTFFGRLKSGDIVYWS